MDDVSLPIIGFSSNVKMISMREGDRKQEVIKKIKLIWYGLIIVDTAAGPLSKKHEECGLCITLRYFYTALWFISKRWRPITGIKSSEQRADLASVFSS